MSPDDLRTVQSSWPMCLRHREPMLEALAVHLDQLTPSPIPAAQRSGWLFRAVEELVELLDEPSCLELRARHLGEAWPDKQVAPSYSVDGRAWMRAARDCVPTWSSDVEAAWKQAWLLLSEVLAAETLNPFSGCS